METTQPGLTQVNGIGLDRHDFEEKKKILRKLRGWRNTAGD